MAPTWARRELLAAFRCPPSEVQARGRRAAWRTHVSGGRAGISGRVTRAGGGAPCTPPVCLRVVPFSLCRLLLGGGGAGPHPGSTRSSREYVGGACGAATHMGRRPGRRGLEAGHLHHQAHPEGAGTGLPATLRTEGTFVYDGDALDVGIRGFSDSPSEEVPLHLSPTAPPTTWAGHRHPARARLPAVCLQSCPNDTKKVL